MVLARYFDTPPFSRENLHMLATFIGNVHPMLPAVHKQACNTQSDCSPVILVTNFPSSSLVCSPVMCIARSVFWLASTHVAQYRVKLSPGPRIEIEELLSFSLSCTSPTRDANLKILVVCLFMFCFLGLFLGESPPTITRALVWRSVPQAQSGLVRGSRTPERPSLDVRASAAVTADVCAERSA